MKSDPSCTSAKDVESITNLHCQCSATLLLTWLGPLRNSLKTLCSCSVHEVTRGFSRKRDDQRDVGLARLCKDDLPYVDPMRAHFLVGLNS
ncbi:hypothetical protein PoB_003233700 [Plakobranchus ocellatus]|uniref:Uncharacterized protein n=1 Tax=Plakobranchus ocellatus TaxID=259542 RepID=A0AAV4AG02_9GAST|nr:hypothetical protein PoB_003233700 [Plakobranchus ocellatus]